MQRTEVHIRRNRARWSHQTQGSRPKGEARRATRLIKSHYRAFIFFVLFFWCERRAASYFQGRMGLMRTQASLRPSRDTKVKVPGPATKSEPPAHTRFSLHSSGALPSYRETIAAVEGCFVNRLVYTLL